MTDAELEEIKQRFLDRTKTESLTRDMTDMARVLDEVLRLRDE